MDGHKIRADLPQSRRLRRQEVVEAGLDVADEAVAFGHPPSLARGRELESTGEHRRVVPSPEGNMMPLSEQEQRLLEEMERSLYRNDADFVATVSGRRSRPNYTMVVVGVLVIVLGIAALAAGVITKLAIIGILGFAIMIVGALLIFSPRVAP
ncbi:DUF3040 domain-containing protein [Clavibacter zhangzhiyongii]|uniref:DUF3040 domain-containing protein n=1 Tax=Clavibacter zhangzhiyongii TaxID=2768071 RepID=UPI0039DF7D67